MSLVADYGDSTSGTESDSEESVETDISDIVTKSRSAVTHFSATGSKHLKSTDDNSKLPTPDFIDLSSKTSVFTNPFKQAEDAKQAILEKHVKMVNLQNNTSTINGRKVCWNYRKGKCRFGHNCIYAHDSDVQKTPEQISNEAQEQQTILCQSQEFSKRNDNCEEVKMKQSKKRPGLTQGLVPGKKVMKNYHKQQHVLKNKQK
ncbi:hypothetical protein FQA39_LY14139 [Lamprigera yunnana]|nr:hypothetical protein FQA39_LY14139 [Lamprigera yunnana]